MRSKVRVLELAKQARAVATRQRILQAAAEVFEEYGYAAATMALIFERAGMTKGALYFHFTSKEDLAKAVVQTDQMLATDLTDNTGSPLQIVIDTTHGFARRLQEDVMTRASVRLAIEYGTFNNPREFTTYAMWQETLRALLEKAQTAGELRRDLDPDAVSGLVIGTVSGLQLVSQVMSGRGDLEDRITNFWRVALPGLTPADRSRRFFPEGSAVVSG
ncbi:ScbR family autoregulator-binding transcription factor [Planomonospora algeriensis]